MNRLTMLLVKKTAKKHNRCNNQHGQVYIIKTIYYRNTGGVVLCCINF
ncbi:hypothetical protein ABID22_001705 [Pontibacter aydingkolensis]